VLFGFGQTNAAEYVQSYCWFRFSSRYLPKNLDYTHLPSLRGFECYGLP
jgi:hypothetical protein